RLLRDVHPPAVRVGRVTSKAIHGTRPRQTIIHPSTAIGGGPGRACVLSRGIRSGPPLRRVLVVSFIAGLAAVALPTVERTPVHAAASRIPHDTLVGGPHGA